MSVASHSLAVPAVSHPDREPSRRDLLALRFQWAAGTMAYGVGIIAAAGLAGWIFDVPGLTRVFPGFVSMKVNTAVVLLFTAVSLWVHRQSTPSELQELVLKVSSGLAIAIAVANGAQYATGWNLHIDQLLIADAEGGPGVPGRMALTTSICIVLLNTALLLALTGARDRVAQALVGTSLLVTLIDGVGYLLDPLAAAGAGPTGTMSLMAAVALLLAGVAFFLAHSTRGWMDAVIDTGPGGLMIRRLLPAVAVLPMVLAWLSWRGVQMDVYGPTFALALVVSLTIGAFGYAVWSGGGVLRHSEVERLTAETERQASEDRLKRAVAGAPVPMVIHNGDRILHMSQGWTATSGYSIEETPTLSAWISRAQPQEAEAMLRYLKELEDATGTVETREQLILTKEGQERTWELSTTPLGEPGANRLFVSMAADVSERKEAERQLRRMNEGLEQRIAQRTAELTRVNDALKRQSDQLKEQAALLDLVRDGILVRDLRGTIVYWSAGAKEMYGWERTAALGKVSHQLLQAAYSRPLPEIEAHVLKEGFWEGEVVHTTQGGTRIFVETRLTLTRTERGAPEGFLEVNRDITARKHAELSLRDSELRFRAVAETAREGIVSADEGGRIRYWNPGAEQLFGRSAAEVVGQPIRLALPEESLSPYHQQARSEAARRTTVESVGRRADGAPFPIEISVTPWSSSQGERFFTCIVRDITARKQAEASLEAKAAELSRSNQELEQFAYVASHDLQEPLRMVANYTKLLGTRYKDKLDADANEFIGYAVDGAVRMQELIRDLLEFARVSTRGKEFKRVGGELVVNHAVSNLSGAIEEAKAEVVVDRMPALVGDASQLAQVFQNLIGNAIKFRRPGERPRVRVSARPDTGGWLIAVADNGIGIDPKHFERIFQMFQRLHARTDYAGTGIGLALCKKIVERHGGRMRVESQPGTGTTFSFTIPEPTPDAPATIQ